MKRITQLTLVIGFLMLPLVINATGTTKFKHNNYINDIME